MPSHNECMYSILIIPSGDLYQLLMDSQPEKMEPTLTLVGRDMSECVAQCSSLGHDCFTVVHEETGSTKNICYLLSNNLSERRLKPSASWITALKKIHVIWLPIDLQNSFRQGLPFRMSYAEGKWHDVLHSFCNQLSLFRHTRVMWILHRLYLS